MSSLIVASTRMSAGKTSVIVGLGKAIGQKIGYLKPLGDRFLYRKKRLWDYDASLLVGLFGLTEEPETISMGFDHSKLRYMYDPESCAAEVKRVIEETAKGKDALFIECGKTLSYGASVCLDPLTLSSVTGRPVVIVTGGTEDEIADDLAFVKRFVGAEEANIGGVILNKVVQPEEFKAAHLADVEALGVSVLGVIPYEEELTTLSASYLAERLFARVIGGEEGLSKRIRHVFVGAMSVNAALAEPLFAKQDKLIITSGDRSDMILAALDAGGTSCLLLSNNIVPPANVTARARQQQVPLLLVPADTHTVAKQVDELEPLLTREDTDKVDLLTRLVSENVDLEAIKAL